MTSGSAFTGGIDDVKQLVASLEGIAQFKQEGCLRMTEDGIHLMSIDDNHVMLIDFLLHRADVQGYTTSQDNISFVTNLKNLSGTLKLGVKRGMAQLSMPAGEMQPLDIRLGSSTFTVQQKPQDSRYTEVDLEPPTTARDACITLSFKDAKRIFKEMTTFKGDVEVSFNAAANTCKLACVGQAGSATMVLDAASPEIVSITGTKDIHQKFDVKYLNNIVKVDLGNKEVHLILRDQMPIEVHHTVGENGHLSFFLAPKVA